MRQMTGTVPLNARIYGTSQPDQALSQNIESVVELMQRCI